MEARLFSRLWFVALALFFVSCASKVEKVQMPIDANPSEEVSQFRDELEQGYRNHIDLLAEKDMSEARKRYDKAQRNLREGELDKVLNEVAYGRAYLNRARAEASKKLNPDSGIIKSRTLALEAGARDSARLGRVLDKIDDDLRKDTKNFSKTVEPAKLARYQRAYLDLELEAIRSEHLGVARAQVRTAANEGAARKAPKSFQRAQLQLKEAENAILADRHNPSQFDPAVKEATQSAQILAEVMNVIRNSDRRIGEDVALQIVRQNRQIAGLETNLGETKSELEQSRETLGTQSAQLARTEEQIALQRAFEKAQQQFSPEEAEVYQQNDRLLIRLKGIQYPFNTADLTPDAQELLRKVRDVAAGLNPTQIVVEGHTDTIGSRQANKKVSTERAESVAKIFERDPALDAEVEAIGYGFERPLTSNKTEEGRAINRRVDVVIVPGEVQGQRDTDTQPQNEDSTIME